LTLLYILYRSLPYFLGFEGLSVWRVLRFFITTSTYLLLWC
jgi:hypothetical protein